MSGNGQPPLFSVVDMRRPLVGYAADFPNGFALDDHRHPSAQLIHASSGVMTVATAQGRWVVPPQRAVWVPPAVTVSRLRRCAAFAPSAAEAETGRAMFRDYTIVLWLLKLGSLINLYFLVNTRPLASGGADAYIVLPAQILFAVSAYRCLFPVRYEHNVVFHDSIFSSIFVTRLFATFSEIAYIFLFSHVLRLLNVDRVEWVIAVSWLMVAQVVISQGFVWAAILTEQFELYFYEELGWAILFAANTIASACLWLTRPALGEARVLIYLSLLFGLFYLPWQVIHLRLQLSDARRGVDPPMTAGEGLWRSIRLRNPTSDAAAWGGFVGLTWMTGYWATLIPLWVNQVVRVFSR